jgi:hypothetical protein
VTETTFSHYVDVLDPLDCQCLALTVKTAAVFVFRRRRPVEGRPLHRPAGKAPIVIHVGKCEHAAGSRYRPRTPPAGRREN